MAPVERSILENLPLIGKIVAAGGTVLGAFGWLVRLEQRVRTVEKRSPVSTAQCEIVREECRRWHEQRFATDEAAVKELKEILNCIKRDNHQQYKEIMGHLLEMKR